ncbi:MAG: alpha/beta hydrolase [Sulfitobacter sp.]
MDREFDELMGLSVKQRDFQLSPSLSAKDAGAALESMVVQTLAAQSNPELDVQLDIPYGPRPGQKLDVYRPKTAQAGSMPAIVFIHGGFWQEGDKTVSGFAAPTFAALGWASISLGYTLTPDVSLTELTEEIHEGLQYIADHGARLGIDTENVILAGHSAGGHLAATVICDLLGRGAHQLIRGAVLISGVFELAPIAQSYVNDLTRMTDTEIDALSALRHPVQAKVPVHILVGADEPEAFKVQSAVLRDKWSAVLPELTYHLAPGRDHFDVLEEMQDPLSVTVRSIAQMIR